MSKNAYDGRDHIGITLGDLSHRLTITLGSRLDLISKHFRSHFGITFASHSSHRLRIRRYPLNPGHIMCFRLREERGRSRSGGRGDAAAFENTVPSRSFRSNAGFPMAGASTSQFWPHLFQNVCFPYVCYTSVNSHTGSPL